MFFLRKRVWTPYMLRENIHILYVVFTYWNACHLTVSRDLNESWQQKYPRHTSFLIPLTSFSCLSSGFALSQQKPKSCLQVCLFVYRFSGVLQIISVPGANSKTYESTVKYVTRRRDLALWVFPSQHCHWREIRQSLALSLAAFAQGRSPGAQTVSLTWWVLPKGCLWAGYLKGPAQGCLWRARWGEQPCITLVSRDFAQSICSDKAFLHSSAEEVETNRGAWVRWWWWSD